MGGLASGAIYLASSLTPGGAPPPADAPAPAIVAPAPENRIGGARPYVIVDLPAAADVRPIEAAIAEVVRLDARGGLSAAPVLEPRSEVDLAAAVVAEHDGRIAALRTRQAALRRDHAPSAELATLDAKLRRAEAARTLALARLRLAEGGCTGTACTPPRGLLARSAGDAMAAPLAHEQRAARAAPTVPKHAPAVVRPQPAHRTAVTVEGRAAVRRPSAAIVSTIAQGGAKVTLPSPRPAPAPAVDARALPTSLSPSGSRIASVVALDGPVPPPRGRGDAGASTLAEARRLLAKARAALEAEPSPGPAGLWQWAGSERWSLETLTMRSA